MRAFNYQLKVSKPHTKKKESFINDWKQKLRGDLGPQPIRAAL